MKQGIYTTYARICVFMNVSKPIMESICLSDEYSEWVQTLDYEHIPFHYHNCHENGHLFRDFPLNRQPKGNRPVEKRMWKVL